MAKAPTKSMTEREERFVDEYMKDLNQSEASLRSGITKNKKSAYNSGCRMMARPRVQKEIEKRQKKLSQKSQITVERLIEELALVAFSDIGEMFDENNDLKKMSDVDESTRRALSSVSVEVIKMRGRVDSTTKKVKTYDKLRALQLLGNHLGLFKENTDSTEDLVKAFIKVAGNLPD